MAVAGLRWHCCARKSSVLLASLKNVEQLAGMDHGAVNGPRFMSLMDAAGRGKTSRVIPLPYETYKESEGVEK